MTVVAPAEDATQAVANDSTDVLFHRFRRTGDARLRDQLVARFMPLARKLAHRYHAAGEPIDDLVQVASVGLLKAVDRFDDQRGVSFTTYAVPTITGELKRYFRDNSWAVHVPRGTRDRALRIHGAIREISEQTGQRPATEQLAEQLDLSEHEVDDALGALTAFDAISLDGPAFGRDEPDSQSRSETLGSIDRHYELAEHRIALDAELDRLPSRDRRVLQMRFVEDRTQSDIAAHIGVSQMQVSRILRHTLERLRVRMERAVAA
jgi:RNA polymerase sigma-B factor